MSVPATAGDVEKLVRAEGRVEELRDRMDALQARIDKATRARDERRALVDGLEARRGELDARLAAARSRREELEAERAAGDESDSEIERSVAQLRQRLDDLRSQASAADADEFAENDRILQELLFKIQEYDARKRGIEAEIAHERDVKGKALEFVLQRVPKDELLRAAQSAYT